MVKKIFYKVALIFSICYFSEGYAQSGGHVIGNGGYVLKCEKQNVITFESYDILEGRVLYDIEPVYSKKNDFLQKAEDIIKRLEKLNPSRTKLYLQWLSSFLKESKFLPKGVNLIDVPDISIGIRPDNCKLIQTIVQTANFEKQGYRYIIDTEVWDSLDNDNKAALIIHELIYREAVLPENNHPNSLLARELNQLIHSDKVKNMSLKQFIDFLFEHRFAQADAHGVPIGLFNFNMKSKEFEPFLVTYWNDNLVRTATVYWKGKIKLNSITANYNCSHNIYQQSHDSETISFYEDGSIQEITLPVNAEVDWNVNGNCGGGVLNLENYGFSGLMRFNHLEFSEKGVLKKASANGLLQGKLLYLKDIKFELRFELLEIYTIPVITLLPFDQINFVQDLCSRKENKYTFDWYVTEPFRSEKPLKAIKLSDSKQSDVIYCK
jgi:hypothetical protein